jgi:hypothetical protein
MKTISKLISYILFTSLTAHAQPELNVTQKEFREIIALVVASYRPIFEKKEVDFWIEADWQSNDCSIYSKKFADASWKIYVSGCFVRQPEITDEGFIMALCHQMGHLLGGTFSGYATEKAAEAYASDICAEIIFKEWSKRYNLKMYNVTLPECEKSTKNKDVCYYKAFGKQSLKFLGKGFCHGPQSESNKGY